jgi:tetratricopeptide (TPR) repeat protein
VSSVSAQPAATDPAAPAGAPAAGGECGRMLEFGRTLSKQKKYADASVKFWQILKTGSELETCYKDAEFELALNLFRLNFYQSAYMYLERIADAGPAHPHYAASLRWLLELHDAVPGDMSPLAKMALYEPELYPRDIASELYFLVGQFYYYEGDLDRSLEMLGQVQPTDEEHYLMAKYLSGVVYVRRNEAKPALEAFKEILRYAQSNPGSDAATRFAPMATLSLARIFYTTKQYATAIRYYDQIADFSPYWLDSLFEVSWAYFQLESYGKALGNLHTLVSPYFEEEYFPEAQVLQAVIFYYNCRYDDALEVIDAFIKDYWPLKKELETQLSSYSDPNEFYLFLARLSKKEAGFSLRLKRIFNAALSDEKLNRLFGLVVHLNKEIEGLRKLKEYAPAHDMADSLVGDVIAYRELVIGEAGELARSRLQRVNRELKELLAQALKVKFETLNRQKKELVGGGTGEVVERRAPEPRVDDEHVGWKFRGAYWQDELDSYIFKVASQCPAEAETTE